MARKSKPFKPDYTAGDVLGLYEVRKNDGDEGRIRALAEQMRSYCKLEHAVEIPDQYRQISKEVRTPFMRDSWHRITSSLVAKPPIAHITPRDDNRQEFREAANIAERFDMAMIERFSKELGIDVIFDAAAKHVRDGESVIKVVHRPAAWANFPLGKNNTEEQDQYKKGADLPIAWSVVDRLCVVYEGGEYGDQWVLEYGEYTKPYLRSRYGMVEQEGRLINPKTMLEGSPLPEGLQSSSTGRSVKVEFFTADEWHVIIDGSEAPGWPKRSPYSPHLPYFRAPAYDHESLLYSLLFLVPRLDELLTMKLNWSYLGAYPNPVLETVPNSNAFPLLDGPLGNAGEASGTAGQKALTWSPGKLMDLPIGRKLSFLTPPPVGGDINDLLLIFKNLIDIAGVPSIMRGVSGAGDSGYLASQLRAGAEMVYKLSLMSCQRQLEKAVEFSHWLVPNVVKQTVFVLGWQEMNPKTGKPNTKAGNAYLGLSPDHQGKNIADVTKLGPVSFQFRPTLPTDEQARAMIALQLTNADKPLYDVRHALETWMQEEDPESIIKAIYVEKTLNENPTLNQMVVDNALEEAGIKRVPEPNPASLLVGPNGMPLIPQGGPMSPGMQGVPLANQMVQGTPAVPGLTIPILPGTPSPPQGIPGATGGRPSGSFPGQPSNQGPGG